MESKLYKLYDINKHIGYVNLADKDNLTLDLFPNLDIVSVPVHFWDNYEEGELHFKGTQVYNWIDYIVKSMGKDTVLSIMDTHEIKEYNPLEILYNVNKDSLIGENRFEACNENDEYRNLLKIDKVDVAEDYKLNLKEILNI